METTKKTATPKLVCNITGASRVTTRDYLDLRLAGLKCTEQHFLEHYACKDAMKQLRAGKSIADIRRDLKSTETATITDAEVKEMLRINGKQKGGSSGPALSPRAQRELAAKAAAATSKPAATVTGAKAATGATK